MPIEIRIRSDEGCDPQPFLLWDSVWVQDRIDAVGGYADWALAEPDERQNFGGLRAKAALHSAILIALFTDRRLPADAESPDGSGDPRGWWGDSVDVRTDLAEAEMGSHLWLLERGRLDDTETVRLAEDYAREALQPLVNQGAVARFDVTAEARSEDGWLVLAVAAFSHDGARAYEQRFDLLWQQTR